MGTRVVCHNCKRNIYLEVPPEGLTTNFKVQCNYCGITDTYYSSESYEERWNYTCVFCKSNFFRKLPPPGSVTCPYCNAKLSIDYNDQVTLQVEGTQPSGSSSGGTIAGGILGALLGAAVAGSSGAVLGGLLGLALGSSGSQEAIEGW